jgi:hypothetical protein
MQFAKLKKNSNEIFYSTLFLNEKMQKIWQKTHIGYIDASDLKFCSIGLEFEPHVHKEF